MSLFTLRCPHCGSLWPHDRTRCALESVSAAINDVLEASRELRDQAIATRDALRRANRRGEQ